VRGVIPGAEYVASAISERQGGLWKGAEQVVESIAELARRQNRK
jgi:hypothetical protein